MARFLIPVIMHRTAIKYLDMGVAFIYVSLPTNVSICIPSLRCGV
jgi:hypothetical protein